MLALVRQLCLKRSAMLALTLAAAFAPCAAGAAPHGKVRVKASVRRPAAPRPFTSTTVSPPDGSARKLLRQMLQAEQRVSLSGDQVTYLLRNGQPVTSEQHVLRNGTHAFRMDYLQPPSLAGETIIDNGRTFWHYSPANKKMEVGPSRIDRLRSRVPEVMNQIKERVLTVQYLGQDIVAGKNCAVVEVAGRDLTQSPRRRFWIDPTNGAQLRIDQFGAGGQLQSSSYYTSVSYNPVIPPGAFTPPVAAKGTRVTAPEATVPSLTIPQAQAQAGFPIQQPTYLPTGFRFQTSSVSDFRQQKLVALRYVNGLNVLSLFESPLGPRAAGQPTRINRPRPGVLIMTQNGLRFILVGNLSNDEMEKVIISVH